MQQPPVGVRKLLIDNLGWFLASLALAVMVWFVAISQTDPIETWRIAEAIPIRIEPDAGLIITNSDTLTRNAYVQLTAQSSVRSLITADDIVVTAPLAGLTPGTHVVPLQATTALNARIDAISPSQITVTLEVEAAQYVPVRELIVNAPPPDMRTGSIDFDVLQVQVSGPETLVSQVTAAQAPLDLADQRAVFEGDVRLVPVDVDGNPVSGVLVDPQVTHVTVDIERSESVRALNVRPRIVGDPPAGYFLTTFDYSPQTVYVNVPAGASGDIPDFLYTEPIDLTNRTADFTLSVPVQLPSPDWLLITDQDITVTIGISAQTVTRQFDDVRVNLIGAHDGFSYAVEPTAVALIVTGAQPLLEPLAIDDVRVTVDVSSITESGSYRLTPTTSITSGESILTTELSVSILPPEIAVQVIAGDATPEATTGGT